MKETLLFLGTGASLGIPVIGCECEVCQSTSPYNQRLRSSALIQCQGKVFLIDVGPDFRQQALKYHIKTLDGVLFTHAHQDHTAGIDDLRAIRYRRETPLPVLASAATAYDITERFSYLFKMKEEKAFTVFDLQILPQLEGEIVFEGVPLTYVAYQQGGMWVNGFRFGNLAYLSDIRIFAPSIFDYLKGVDTIIISALRQSASPLHLSVEEAIAFIDQAGAKQGWLTHISHDLEYHQTNHLLPSHIRMAYDGLEIDFKV